MISFWLTGGLQEKRKSMRTGSRSYSGPCGKNRRNNMTAIRKSWQISSQKMISAIFSLRKLLADSSIEALCDGQCKMVPFSELYERAGEGGTPSTSKRACYDNGDIPFIKTDDLKSKYITKHQDNISSYCHCDISKTACTI